MWGYETDVWDLQEIWGFVHSLRAVHSWSWIRLWPRGLPTPTASPPAHPAAWGSLYGSPAGGDGETSCYQLSLSQWGEEVKLVSSGWPVNHCWLCVWLTVKTFSGSPRARMFVSWICLRTIHASSCFPIWRWEKTQICLFIQHFSQYTLFQSSFTENHELNVYNISIYLYLIVTFIRLELDDNGQIPNGFFAPLKGTSGRGHHL